MADSNGPKTVVAVWSLTGIAFLFMNLRFFCKGVYQRQLRIDDAILLFAWFLTVIYAALITVSVSYGLGKHERDVDPANWIPLNKYLYLGEFFTLISIPVSKTSFAVTLLRIAAKQWHKWIIWFIILSMNLAMWLCAILILVQCNPIEKNWNVDADGTCWDPRIQDDFAVFAGAYSSFLDFTLAMFPCVIVYRLQMSGKEKAGVIIAMSLGFLAGITAAVKTSFLPGAGDFKDPNFDLTDLLIWSLAETAVTIIAASIPFFRVLLRHARSSYKNRSHMPHGNSYWLESYGSKHGGLGTAKIRHSEIREIGERDDDHSERSIPGDDMSVCQGGQADLGRIVKSSEVRIEWHDEKEMRGA